MKKKNYRSLSPVFFRFLIFNCFLAGIFAARGQGAGSVDTSFDPGSGANSTVFSVATQSDGKVLIGGAFSTFNGVARSSIARLNASGSLDTSFNPGSGANSYVFSVATQTDGKVLIGGWFNQVNGVTRYYIARLNANGSVDMSFDPGSGANQRVYAVAVQSDGKILIGGLFTQFNGVARGNIARLNANGSLDTSFDPGTGANNEVRTLAIQTNGKIVIGGSFTQVNGITRSNIARLNANGSVDTSFDPGSGANSWVSSLAINFDGKVVIGGNFIQVNGVTRYYIARLNANGSVDMNFDPGSGANQIVYGVAVQTDGKVLIGGEFIAVNGVTRAHIARLNANGSVDMSFDPGSGANNFVSTVAVQSDGRVLIGGGFNQVDGVTRWYIARLNGSAKLVSVVSRKVHGSAGSFDIDLPLTGNVGVECRTGGASSVYKLIFSFVNTLTSVGGASVTSGSGSVSSQMIGANTHQYIVNLTGVTNAQIITVTLTNVNDSAGNSSSAVPISMGVLIGDTTGSGSVNASDIGQTKSRSGQSADSLNFRSDVNFSGSINASDIGLVKSKAGMALP